MTLACTGGLNMVHVGAKIWKMAENGRRCAHSWWGQIGYTSDLEQGMPWKWNQVLCVHVHIWFERQPNPPGFGNAGVAK